MNKRKPNPLHNRKRRGLQGRKWRRVYRYWGTEGLAKVPSPIPVLQKGLPGRHSFFSLLVRPQVPEQWTESSWQICKMRLYHSSWWKPNTRSKRRALCSSSTSSSFVFSGCDHNLIIIAMALRGLLTCINQPGPSSLTRFFTLLPCPRAS